MVVEAILQRLSLLCDLDTSTNHKPSELVLMGMVDPVKVFVKSEPHKIAKLQEGRVRLICSVSLIDNVIAKMLCSLQNNTEILHHSTLPVKPGLGLHDDGLRSISEYVKTHFAECTLAEADVKGWDWSVQEADFKLDCDRRIALAGAKGTVFERLLRAHFYCMARKVFVLSDGTMHEQLRPGVMPSGWYNTSSSNSSMRCINHYILAAEQGFSPRVMAMGDDSLERSFPNAMELYKTLGKTVSMFNDVEPDDFEFCSTRFKGELGYPVNADKQIFTLLSNEKVTPIEATELWQTFRYEMRNHPQKSEIFRVIHKSGWLRQFDIPQSRRRQIGFRKVIAQNGFRAKQNAERLHGATQNQMNVSGNKSHIRYDSSECDLDDSLCIRYDSVKHQRFNSDDTWCDRVYEMNSPGWSLRHPIQMTKTKNNKKRASAKVKQLEKKLAEVQLSRKQQAPKKKTPFADVGGTLGGVAGGFFGNSKVGSSIGRWLGSGIGSIFGSGDYRVVGQPTKYNILAGSVPQFSSTRATNIVCHREYIGDITGTSAFNNNVYPLNPGVPTAFPWLQSVAVNYQQYRFHGIMFEFRPLLTDYVTSGAPGVVVMSTNYNSDLPKYVSKQEMENAEFAVSTKPTEALRHMVECDPLQTTIKELYVRGGPVPSNQDLRLYDLGNFQFATQSNPNQNLGELWVTYCVEFFKPTSDLANQNTSSAAAHIVRSGVAATTPLGTTTLSSNGSLSYTLTSTVLTITNAVVGVVYNINMIFTCQTATTNALAVPGVVGATGLTWNATNGSADSANYMVTTGTASTVSSSNQYLTAIANTIVLTYPTSGTYGAGSPTLEIYVSAVDPFVIA